ISGQIKIDVQIYDFAAEVRGKNIQDCCLTKRNESNSFLCCIPHRLLEKRKPVHFLNMKEEMGAPISTYVDVDLFALLLIAIIEVMCFLHISDLFQNKVLIIAPITGLYAVVNVISFLLRISGQIMNMPTSIS
ncbi:hypothetical protein ACJX0J_012390, partial [Zea mays]